MAEILAPYTTDKVCPECKGEKGFIIKDPQGLEFWKPCECYKREQTERLLQQLFSSAKIPVRYRNKSLANFNQLRQPKAFKGVQEYLRNWQAVRHSGHGVIFSGDVGTGKTHLAYALLLELLKEGVTGLATTVPDLMDDLRPKKGETSERQSRQIETLKTVDLLLLDDLGAQRDTPWVTERLFIILNARYNNMLPTIITSNERLETLEKIPGWKRIVDRIVEMCSVVVMDGESYRVLKATGKA